MEYKISDIVLSLCGRDKNKLFVVTGMRDGFLFIADGRLRKVENAKKKKIKHVCLVSHGSGETAEKISAGEKVLNSEIRKMLDEHYRQSGGIV